jgi:hypothetical protein
MAPDAANCKLTHTPHTLKQAKAISIDVPVCPAGHIVLTCGQKTISLKFVEFQRYETFCNHCQRRYIIVRWKITNPFSPRSQKGWHIWQYKTFPGPDGYQVVTRPPAEMIEVV